jgi:acyl carrier protein
MGLDSVELVMAFEEQFEIAIPNEVAEKLQTVGDVVDYVTARLAAEGRPRSRDDVLVWVNIITCDQCGTRLDELTESTSFVKDLGID